jgi:hypothetical protein
MEKPLDPLYDLLLDLCARQAATQAALAQSMRDLKLNPLLIEHAIPSWRSRLEYHAAGLHSSEGGTHIAALQKIFHQTRDL